MAEGYEETLKRPPRRGYHKAVPVARTFQKLAFPLGTHEDPTVYTSVCLTVAEFLPKLQPTSDPAGVNHLQLFLICLAGWINRNQQNAIEYLQEDVQVLREQLGKKPRFNYDQHRRLAPKAKRIGLQQLKEITAIVTPRTLLGWLWDAGAARAKGGRPFPGHQSLPAASTARSVANACFWLQGQPAGRTAILRLWVMQPATSFCPGTMEPARLNGNAILLLGASNLSDLPPFRCIDDKASARRTVMLREQAEAEVGLTKADFECANSLILLGIQHFC